VAVPRVILHLDMDAFFAAVEVRENPALIGKALIIGRRGRRGVVSTCSYEARRFGVRSAMPALEAERLCPHAVWLPGRMSHYSQVSREIFRIMRSFSPLVEPVSVDEAFIDLTGIADDLPSGARLGLDLKRRIRIEQRLTGSAGVAPNKFLAKLASDLEKPDGLVVFPMEELPVRLWPMPVGRLWGVGPKTARRLEQGGIVRVGQLLEVSRRDLASLVGPAAAAHLRALASGRDKRPVTPEHRTKSVSEERTYGDDLTEPRDIDRVLLARSAGVARQLRREGLVGRTVHIKVRTGDYRTRTRSLTLPAATDLADPIVEAARRLLHQRIRLGGQGIRLLGVGVSGLEPAGSGQADLFEDAQSSRARRLAQAADAVREKIGEGAVTRARLLHGGRAGKKPSRPRSPD
jgi:DNA polymerase-4